MKDLTILFITANETPGGFASYHRSELIKAAEEYPIITIGRKQLDFGYKNLLDTEPKSYYNIYKQMLVGAKEADTDYVAIAEDDTFYPAEHFSFYRPEKFAYNMNKWSLYTWYPVYTLKERITNATLIAKREYLIKALEERLTKYPTSESYPKHYLGEIGRNTYERLLGITQWQVDKVYSDISCVQISHPSGTENAQRFRRKRPGKIKAYNIPYWGESKKLAKIYK